jgi:hypothetical protein
MRSSHIKVVTGWWPTSWRALPGPGVMARKRRLWLGSASRSHEMGVAFLCAMVGIANEHTDRNAIAYIQNWIARLEADNQLVIHVLPTRNDRQIASSTTPSRKRPRQQKMQ